MNSIRPIWRWATFSRIAAVLIGMAAVSIPAGPLPGGEAAVRMLLPGCSYERETRLLTEEELAACAAAAGQESVGALVTRYVARKDGRVAGYAYLDKHRVRTLPQTLMVALDADGVLLGIQVLAFREPAEYMPREGWMEQFKGKTAEDEIRMKKNIDGMTGATLTARAVTQCARRVMTVHQVLEQKREP